MLRQPKAESSCSPTAKFPWCDWVVLSLVGIAGVAVVALMRVHETTGWFDQKRFHWPTIWQFAQQLPLPDIIHARTSTGPTYHLIAAIPTRVFGLSAECAQLVMGILVWSALAAALLGATNGVPRALRRLIAIAVFASPYVLESTLWMCTDALALTLCIVALILIVRLCTVWEPSRLHLLRCGFLIAFTCTVRQSAAWLVVAAAVAIFAGGWKASEKVKMAILVAFPPIATLAAFFFAWDGFAPPGMDDIAKGPEPLGMPVGFAMWAFFATPLLLPLWQRVSIDARTVAGSFVAGALCAVPALIWRSDYEAPDRAGGWLWKAVIKYGVDFSGRSFALFLLAFIGGAAIFLILRTIYANGLKGQALVLGAAIYASILVTVPIHSALQKYREIPLLACFPFLVMAVGSLAIEPARRRWESLQFALAVPASVQVIAGFGTVGLPVFWYLIDAGGQ